MGFLIDFPSHAAIVGFMGGAAITIALQQLKGFLGIQKLTKKTDIISVMRSVFEATHHGVSLLALQTLDVYGVYLQTNGSLMHNKLNLMYRNFFYDLLQWNWQTIVIGVAFLSFLLFAKYIVRISLASCNCYLVRIYI